MKFPPHDPEKILVNYTLNGEAKSFKCGMDRLDDLIAWANKEFGNESEPVGPNPHELHGLHSVSTAFSLAIHKAKRKA
jgi:hypothetical protein